MRIQDEEDNDDDDGDEADDEGIIHRRHGSASGASHHSHSQVLLTSRSRSSPSYSPAHGARSPSASALSSQNPLHQARSPLSPLRFSFTAESLSLSSLAATSSPTPSSTLPEDKKGLEKTHIDGLLRASVQRRAGTGIRINVDGPDTSSSGSGSNSSPNSSPVSPGTNETMPLMPSGRRSMDLRREITLKAHAAKQGQLNAIIHSSLAPSALLLLDFVGWSIVYLSSVSRAHGGENLI